MREGEILLSDRNQTEILIVFEKGMCCLVNAPLYRHLRFCYNLFACFFYTILMTAFKKRYRRIYAAWVVISILAIISMVFFLMAPIFYR